MVQLALEVSQPRAYRKHIVFKDHVRYHYVLNSRYGKFHVSLNFRFASMVGTYKSVVTVFQVVMLVVTWWFLPA